MMIECDQDLLCGGFFVVRMLSFCFEFFQTHTHTHILALVISRLKSKTCDDGKRC